MGAHSSAEEQPAFSRDNITEGHHQNKHFLAMGTTEGERRGSPHVLRNTVSIVLGCD